MSAWARLSSAARRRPLLTVGLALAALVLLSVVAAYGGLQTRTGKDALARYLENQLSVPGLRTVEIGRIDGTMPHRIRIDRLAVADRDGVWLSIEDIHLDWRPLALVRGILSVEGLTAERTVASRWPTSGDRAAAGPGVPALPLAVSVDLVAFRSLTLEEPVLGQAATLRLEANGAFTDGVVEAAFAAQRTDETPGTADLWLAYDAATRVLDLEATASEPQGGLLARLAGLPGLPAVDVSIGGEGPPDAWRGSLRADAEGLVSVESRVSVVLGDGVKVGLEGFAEPGRELADAARAALLPTTDFAADFAWPADRDKLDISVTRLESGLFRASGAAKIGLVDWLVAGSASLDVGDASPLSPYIDPVAVAAVSADVSFDGPLAGPEIDVRGRLIEFAIDTVRAREMTVDVRLVPDDTFGSPELALSFGGHVEAAGFASGIDSLHPLLGPSPAADFEALYRSADARIDIARLRVDGEGGAATATGALGLAPWRIDAQGTLDLRDMGSLSRLAQRPLGGTGRADYRIVWAEGADLDLQLSGTVDNPKIGHATAEALLGQQASLAGQLSLTPGGALSMTGLRVSGRAIEASGAFSMPPAGDSISADYAASITDLAPLGLVSGRAGAGRLETAGTASGPPGDPTAKGTATIEAIALGGVALDRLAVRYSVDTVVSRPAGDVSFQGAGPLLPDLSGSLGFTWAGDLVRMDNIAASARGTGLTGNVAISLAGAPAVGRLHLAAADIGRWSDIAGLDLSGGAEASVQLAVEQDRQAVRVYGTGRNVAVDGTVAAAVEFDATLRDPGGGGQITASATARQAALPVATLSRTTLAVDGTLQDANLSLQAEGEMRGKLQLAAEGRIVRATDETRITVSRLEGEAAGGPVLLHRPVTATFGAATEVKDLALDIGGGHLTGDFRMAAERAVMNARVTAIPLGLLAPGLPPQFAAGKADAEVALDGRPTRPDGTIRLSVSGLAPGEARIAPEGLTLHFDGTLRSGALTVNGSATGLESVETDLSAVVPVKFSLSPLDVGLVDDQPARGELSYAGPVDPAWGLAGLDRHRLSGHTDTLLRFSGTLEDPLIDGRVELTEGRYENLDTGTILSEMELVARPSISAIVIERATARDGADGQVSASGRLDFGAADHMAIDLAARFEQARLVRRDELVAVVTGELTLTGSTEDRLLSGQLEVNEAEIRLVGGLPQSVVEIDVIEKGAEADRAAARPAPAPSHTRLDLQIDMPKRVFVRGRGLDSEWGGQLLVSGTTSTPRIEGELRPLRGRYDFAGKSFNLQEGSIGFTGAREINPVLDLSAARKAGDLIAIIRVTGSARQPVIRMESDPALPQDEVLSRILFNKSTGRLSATEALRLSQAVATLSGAGDGGGFMDFARGMLNLDVLRFTGGDGEEDGSAQAGKYLSDKVFVGVEAGGSAGSSGATVEVEVTPNLKIEGDVSGDEKSEIGIKWKRDY